MMQNLILIRGDRVFQEVMSCIEDETMTVKKLGTSAALVNNTYPIPTISPNLLESYMFWALYDNSSKVKCEICNKDTPTSETNCNMNK